MRMLMLFERVKNRKSIRWSTRHRMPRFEPSKRPALSKLCPRNIEDKPLLFAGIKACSTDVAYNPEFASTTDPPFGTRCTSI